MADDRDYEENPEVIMIPLVISSYAKLDDDAKINLIKTLQSEAESISSIIGEVVDDFGLSIADDLIAVPFGGDGLEGDSSWDGGLYQDYKDQSFDELEANMIDVAMNQWKYADREGTKLEYDEAYDDLQGYWIISKALYDLFIFPECGSDSSLYRAVNTFKTFIATNAVKVVEKG